MDFSDRQHLGEQEINDLLKLFEKENIELVMQEELDSEDLEIEGFEKDDEGSKVAFKAIEDTLEIPEEEDLEGIDAEEEKEQPREGMEPSYISDGVKGYLRDIGKIPLLNKKTETEIADQIASGKGESIDSLSKFPFIHKEIVSTGERVSKSSLPLKEVIQFSEFDEENLPKYEQEKNGFVETTNRIKNLIENEDVIYRSYRDKLSSENKKEKC